MRPYFLSKIRPPRTVGKVPVCSSSEHSAKAAAAKPPLHTEFYANGVSVGSLERQVVDEIYAETFKDWRTYARQAWSIGGVVLRMASRGIVLFPVAWFWLVVVWVVQDPRGFGEAVQTLSASPNLLQAALVNSFEVVAGLVLVAMVIALAFELSLAPGHLGLKNEFKEGINLRIRKKLGLAVDAPLVGIPLLTPAMFSQSNASAAGCAESSTPAVPENAPSAKP